MPVFAVVTNPPILGLAMFHSENGIEMFASTSTSLPTRSAETGKDTDLVTPWRSRSPTALYLWRAGCRDRPEADRRREGQRRCGVSAHIHDRTGEARVALALVAHDGGHVDGERSFRHVEPAMVRDPQILLVRPTAVALWPSSTSCTR